MRTNVVQQGWTRSVVYSEIARWNVKLGYVFGLSRSARVGSVAEGGIQKVENFYFEML